MVAVNALVAADLPWLAAISVLRMASSLQLEGTQRTYNSLLSRAPWADGLAHVRSSGLLPDVVTYNTLMKTCGAWEVASGWSSEMSAHSLRSDLISFTCLMDSRRDVKLALFPSFP